LFGDRSLDLIRFFRAHQGRVRDLDFSPDGRTLLSVGDDTMVRFWSASDGSMIREVPAEGGVPIYSARFNPGNPDKFMLVGDRNGVLKAWDLQRSMRITNLPLHEGAIHAVGYQPSGGGHLCVRRSRRHGAGSPAARRALFFQGSLW
jgi:WD40 repeat protein